jgi:RimJ/RimL family protein N-acetyltransferase
MTFIAKDGTSVIIRALQRTDLDGLLKFVNTIVKEKKTNPRLGIVSFDKRFRRSDEKKYLDKILLGIRKKETVSVAAFVSNKIVGHCDISRRKSAEERHAGYFGILILDGYREKGIGQMMVKTALEEASRIGVWLVELGVFAFNPIAIHVYEKCGFKRAGVVPRKFLHDGKFVDEIRMYRDGKAVSD